MTQHVVVDDLAQNNRFVLRQATAADVDRIWQIEQAVFGNEAWTLDLMREELSAKLRTYLVLLDSTVATGTVAEIVGYGGLLAVGEEGDIQTIALTPATRGLGLGARMMEALIAAGKAQGVRSVFLEVRADNPIARNLYEKLGFVEIAIRPGYYQPDNIDAVVMKLELKDDK